MQRFPFQNEQTFIATETVDRQLSSSFKREIPFSLELQHQRTQERTMSLARHQCDQTEQNYVAEAFNWEQRVRGENDAAREWNKNWGSLFAPNQPTSYKDRIQDLKRKMTEEKLPVQSNYQMSYTKTNPYRKYGQKDHRRKRCDLGDE